MALATFGHGGEQHSCTLRLLSILLLWWDTWRCTITKYHNTHYHNNSATLEQHLEISQIHIKGFIPHARRNVWEAHTQAHMCTYTHQLDLGHKLTHTITYKQNGCPLNTRLCSPHFSIYLLSCTHIHVHTSMEARYGAHMRSQIGFSIQ